MASNLLDFPQNSAWKLDLYGINWYGTEFEGTKSTLFCFWMAGIRFEFGQNFILNAVFIRRGSLFGIFVWLDWVKVAHCTCKLLVQPIRTMSIIFSDIRKRLEWNDIFVFEDVDRLFVDRWWCIWYVCHVWCAYCCDMVPIYPSESSKRIYCLNDHRFGNYSPANE